MTTQYVDAGEGVYYVVQDAGSGSQTTQITATEYNAYMNNTAAQTTSPSGGESPAPGGNQNTSVSNNGSATAVSTYNQSGGSTTYQTGSGANPAPQLSTGTTTLGSVTLPTPIGYNENGAPLYDPRDPAFVQAEIAQREASRERVLQVAAEYGITGYVVTSGGPGGQIILNTINGPVDITDRFKDIPPPPQYANIQVDRQTSTIGTGYQNVTVTVQAPLEQSITVTTANGQAIQVDPNSELARFIQWQGSQPNPTGGGTIGDAWARGGIGDPYSNPAIVQQAQETLARTQANAQAVANAGNPFEVSQPWNDPNWPKYNGFQKDAYENALRSSTDPAFAQQFAAQNGWGPAELESWQIRILDPAEYARRAAEFDRINGFVVGPGGSTTGTSANGATVVTTGPVDSRGFPLYTAQPTARSSITNVPVGNAEYSSFINSGPASVAVSTFSQTYGALPGAGLVTGGLTGSAAEAAIALGSQAITGALALPPAVDPIVQKIEAAVSDSGQLAAAAATAAEAQGLLSQQAAALLRAQTQATLQSRYKQPQSADWRVRLQLAPGATYLYKDPQPGILGPLFETDGVLFPYTPQIETSYAANYDKYELIHSNYRGYFYKNSAVNDINVRASFTAQDTQEANYLLAVIHFFRSVTKMFYGQDALRGAPPPLVYLTGFGNFQFNGHPCLVSNFSYSLPSDVDYIRALAPNNYGTNLITQRPRTGAISSNPLSATIDRLLNTFGTSNPTQPNVPSPSTTIQNVNNTNGATYVPTKMEINITLLPTNTRAQVSQQFSLKEFANGSLLKGGFW